MKIQKLQHEKRQRIVDLQHTILDVVAVAGAISIALVAPNAIALLGSLGVVPSRHQQASIAAARKRLLAKGLVAYNSRGLLALTRSGRAFMEKQKLLRAPLPRKRRWDGIWRVLSFDVAERKKAAREKIRRTLTTVGFVRLQDSTWVFPHECAEFVALLKSEFKIGRELVYMEARIENDHWLRRSFGIR